MKGKPERNLASVIILEDITKNSDLLLKKSLESLDVSTRSRFAKIKKLGRQQQFAVSKFLLKQAIQVKLALPITLDSLPKVSLISRNMKFFVVSLTVEIQL